MDWSKRGKLRGADGAGAQEMKSAAARGNDGGFHADGAGSAIKDKRNAAVEFLHDVGGRSGRDAAKAVGTGCGHRFAEAVQDSAKKGMRAHADSDGGKAGGDNIRNCGTPGQNQREWAGPEAVDEGPNEEIVDGRGEAVEPIQRRQVDDEGIEKWALLGLEDAGSGLGIKRMASEAVNGLCGKGDKLAGSEKCSGLLDAGGVATEKARVHTGWVIRRFPAGN